MHVAASTARTSHCRRVAHMCLAPARKPLVKTTKSSKETFVKSKRLMRDMLVFWRKNEREERDVRKRAEKEAVDRAKEEEEKREAARQARKLEFLISQTELYSHFVENKLKSKFSLQASMLLLNLFFVASEAEMTEPIQAQEPQQLHGIPSPSSDQVEPEARQSPLPELNFDDGNKFLKLSVDTDSGF